MLFAAPSPKRHGYHGDELPLELLEEKFSCGIPTGGLTTGRARAAKRCYVSDKHDLERRLPLIIMRKTGAGVSSYSGRAEHRQPKEKIL